MNDSLSNSATLAKCAYHSVAPGVGGACQCKGFDPNYEENSQRENITFSKKNHFLLNYLLRHSQTKITVFQRRTLTPSSPPVRLHTSFAFHSQAVYQEIETEKKEAQSILHAVIFSCSALSEPQVARRAYLFLNYYSWSLLFSSHKVVHHPGGSSASSKLKSKIPLPVERCGWGDCCCFFHYYYL